MKLMRWLIPLTSLLVLCLGCGQPRPEGDADGWDLEERTEGEDDHTCYRCGEPTWWSGSHTVHPNDDVRTVLRKDEPLYCGEYVVKVELQLGQSPSGPLRLGNGLWDDDFFWISVGPPFDAEGANFFQCRGADSFEPESTSYRLFATERYYFACAHTHIHIAVRRDAPPAVVDPILESIQGPDPSRKLTFTIVRQDGTRERLIYDYTPGRVEEDEWYNRWFEGPCYDGRLKFERRESE